MFKKFPRYSCKSIHILFKNKSSPCRFSSIDNKFTSFGLAISMEKDFIKVYQNGTYYLFSREEVFSVEVSFI